MAKNDSLVCLDVGEKRIGVAIANSNIRIAISFETVQVDGTEIDAISDIIKQQTANILVIGYPRNQSGEATLQTQFVENFVEKLRHLPVKIIFQDESLTSVIAEQQLKSSGKAYQKGDIDARAAAIILQDYIEAHYA